MSQQNSSNDETSEILLSFYDSFKELSINVPQRDIALMPPMGLSKEASEIQFQSQENSAFWEAEQGYGSLEKIQTDLQNLRITDNSFAHQINISDLMMQKKSSSEFNNVTLGELKLGSSEQFINVDFFDTEENYSERDDSMKNQKSINANGKGLKFGKKPSLIQMELRTVPSLNIHSDQAFPDPQIRQKLIYEFLLKLFSNKKLSEKDMGESPKIILDDIRELLSRKYAFGPNFENFQPLKNKRNEEHLKFVFKKGFKRMFQKFKAASNGFVTGSKILDEYEFYKHYFFETFGLDQSELHACFLPGSKIQLKFKTSDGRLDQNITLAYLSKVFIAPKFRADFSNYLEVEFLDDCFESQSKKLLLLAKNCTVGKLNRQMKLPWTKFELEIAKANFSRNIINKKTKK